MDTPMIAESELQECLRVEAERRTGIEDGALTLREIAEAMGVCREMALASVRDALLAGTMESFRAKRQNMIGDWQGVPVYRPVNGNGSHE